MNIGSHCPSGDRRIGRAIKKKIIAIIIFIKIFIPSTGQKCFCPVTVPGLRPTLLFFLFRIFSV